MNKKQKKEYPHIAEAQDIVKDRIPLYYCHKCDGYTQEEVDRDYVKREDKLK